MNAQKKQFDTSFLVGVGGLKFAESGNQSSDANGKNSTSVMMNTPWGETGRRQRGSIKNQIL